MEVHHHPQVEKKSFKEYLLEGLMIFIAVTLGFFAETIREVIHEHHRAGTYAASMIKDLEADTSELRQYISYFDYAESNADTLMQLLALTDAAKIPSGKLYWYGLYGGAQMAFVPNEATFEQMRSSGTLSYMDKLVALDVARYDGLCRQLADYEDNSREVYTQVRVCRAKLFYFQFNDVANSIIQLNPERPDQARIKAFITTNPPLLSTDKTLFNEYVEMVRSRKMGIAVRDAKELLRQAGKLLLELKDSYGD